MSRAPRTASARRSWGDDDSETNILHVDMDAFFVSVELLTKPELRGKPVAVGGQERGVVAAASYEARKYGVNSAMPVGQARRLCPQLIILPATKGLYGQVSSRIMEILRNVTPLVEQLSVDEAFLDVGGARKIFGSPVAIAQQLREQIRTQEHVPASIGIAATKHVAKIASAHAKPDGLLLIPKEATLDFLHGLDVAALWGVGEKTREKLQRRGIETIADLANLGEQRLVSLLGQASGTHLYALAMGLDDRAVQVQRKEKSMSREQTFFNTLRSIDEVEKVLLYQSHDVAQRLRRQGFVSWTLAIKVRFADFSTINRSIKLGAPTSNGADIYRSARQLFSDITIPRDGIRLLGVRAEQLADPGDGIQLTIDDDGRQTKAEEVMDSIRSRFGASSLSPGTLITRHDLPEQE